MIRWRSEGWSEDRTGARTRSQDEEPGARSQEPGARSKEQGARSKEQGAVPVARAILLSPSPQQLSFHHFCSV